MPENYGITQQIFEENVKIREQNKRKIKEHRPDSKNTHHNNLSNINSFNNLPFKEVAHWKLPRWPS
jgi:hypothetical protein